MGYLSVGGTTTSVLTSGGYTFPFQVSLGSSNSVTLADTFVCTKDVYWSIGILNLNNNTLTCGYFGSTSTSTRQIQFGTGSITCTSLGILTDTTYSFNINGTNFTYTGSGQIYATYIAGAKQLGVYTGWSESNALNVTATLSSFGNTYVSYLATFKNLTTVGTGVFSVSNGDVTLYGDLTVSSGTAWNATAYEIAFRATSGTKTVTTNGVTINNSIKFYGVGGTFTLSGSLVCAGTLTLWAGTFNANNYNVTCYNFVGSVTSNVRVLNMGSGTWTLNGSTNGSWNVAATNMTLNASTSTINMAAPINKTFTGGGFTYYILNQASSPELYIYNSNTFNTIDKTYAGATSIKFLSPSTQTVTNFTATGTSGNVLTLLSNSPGFKFTISKSSGQVLLDYVSITDSIATGGARFYAGVHSTNGGNNTGWIFSSPSASASGFFRLFPI
jgi:hypothetical protein